MKPTFFYCAVSIAPIRSENRDSAEMITQLLFGEIVELLESEKQWRKIRSYVDQYEGWIDEKQLSPLTEKEMRRWMDSQSVVYNNTITLSTLSGTLHLTKGAFLPKGETEFNIGKDNYSILDPQDTIPLNISEVAVSYLNAPYLWGGKSMFGIDCSGLTQLVYRLLNVSLPRDAYQQAEDGMEIPFNEIETGDLAFFDNAAGKITHVGIVLDHNKIIHAHGKVRVDTLTNKGILNKERELYSHNLCLIKRYQ